MPSRIASTSNSICDARVVAAPPFAGSMVVANAQASLSRCRQSSAVLLELPDRSWLQAAVTIESAEQSTASLMAGIFVRQDCQLVKPGNDRFSLAGSPSIL